MYCVIQELNLKKIECYGKFKTIEPIVCDYNGRITYSYIMEGRFERPIKKAYKISIHNSYRENGRIKKKQWYICTIQHYSIIDCGDSLLNYVTESKIEKIANDIGIAVDNLYEMIYKKLDPLIDKIEAEYKKTEEYKINKENNKILEKFREQQSNFDNIYGYDTYRECYDVFGNLKNKARLDELKEQKKASDEYEERSRSYYSNNKSNYNYNKYSSYLDPFQGNYNEDEKKLLKKLYRKMSMQFHPDKNQDNPKEAQEMMMLINKLKEQWGI
ncbi:J domain-containing protein [Terrisporobacter petrolearius]|uniref:J domain-containing protein n=1 Tax=Terrisporobacter petrolearius TaxID=1460447 RepID=UPI001D16044F|nr:J domain-containing protein [Terrisporobacter petrolearius]MCC3866325.1 J domain-containing protein [Terrisporobacter petrolearius]